MLSVRVARSAAMRRRYGVDCEFWRYAPPPSSAPAGTQGTFSMVGTFRILTKQVASNLTGAGLLPKTLGVRLADVDSRAFDFSPTDFDPYTSEAAPQVGDRLTAGGFLYQITHVTSNGVGPNTETWLTYGFKVLS